MATDLSFVTGYKIIELSDNQDKFNEPPLERAIYILDDILESSEYEHYLRWINQGDDKSIYIITTNRCIKPVQKRFWNFGDFVPYFKMEENCSSGIIRRIGLDGPVLFNGEYILNDRISQNTIDVETPGVYKTNNKSYSTGAMIDHIFEQYKLYCNSINGVIKVYEHYIGSTKFDLELSCPSIEILDRMLKSRSNCVQAWLGSFEGSYIKASHEVKRKLSDVRLSNGWTIDYVITYENIMEIMENLAMRFRKMIPNATMKIKLGDKTVCMVENILYLGDGVESFQEKMTYTPEGIKYETFEEEHIIAWKDYIVWEITKEITGTCTTIPVSVLKSIFLLFENEPPQILILGRHQYSQIKTIKDRINTGVYDYLKNHTVTKIIIGLLGVCATGAVLTGLYKLYKHFSTDKECESIQPNNDSGGSVDKSSQLMRHIREYKGALMTRDQARIKEVRNEAMKEGFNEALNEWEHEWRTSNSCPGPIDLQYHRDQEAVKELIRASINEEDYGSFDYFWRSNQQLVMSVLSAKPCNRPNSLPEDAKSKQKDLLDAVTHKITSNYVEIYNTYGMNLALALGGREFVTVSHGTPDVGQRSVIRFHSNGKDYNAEVVCTRINRSRDLAFYKCMTKIPEFKDLTKMLTDEETVASMESGTIIKSNGNRHTAPLTYYPKMSAKLVDKSDTTGLRLWDCDEKIITSSTLGLQLPSVIKLGDCGTVMMGYSNNTWHIIGIHIGIQIGQTYFATLTQRDLKFLENKPNTLNEVGSIVNLIDKKEYVLDQYMISLFKTKFETSRYESDNHKLQVLGYNPSLRLYSRPESRVKFYHAPSKLVTDYLPAATSLAYVTDYSDLAVDNQGKPDPLWTQCINYTLTHENSGKWDQRIYDYVTILMTQKMKEDFGKPRTFTLHEVINGRNEANQLPWQTSTGSKIKLRNNIQTKRPKNNPDVIFKESPQGVFKINLETDVGKELLSDYRLKKDAIERGFPFAIIVKDNAKIELIPAEQARKGKVRLYSELELADNMVLKSFFGYIQEKGHANHLKNDWQIGYNPYTDPIIIMKRMNEKPGDVIASDCKRLDKTILKELIKSFVWATRSDFNEIQKEALYRSLTYTIHNINGTIFFLDRGNESGSFITVMLDCYVLDHADVYTICAEFEKRMQRLPTLHEVRQLREQVILGDDRLGKYHPFLELDFKKIQYYYSLFNIHLTPPKTDAEYSFCSRDFIRDIQPFVYLPRLKKESIIARLFYFEKFSKEIVIQNCIGAISEAAFWDADFYSQVEDLVRYRLKEVGAEISYYPQQAFLEFYRLFVLGETGTPLLQPEARANGMIKKN